MRSATNTHLLTYSRKVNVKYTPFVHRLFLGPVSGCWRREVGFYQRLAPELSGDHSPIAYKEGTVFADYYAIVAIRLTA